MGNCKDCDCNSNPRGCSGKYKITLSTRTVERKENLLVSSERKQVLDDTSLDSDCKHYPYGTIKRHQCDECIREFVFAAGDERSLEQVQYYRGSNKTVAANRIEQQMKEYRRTKRIK